MAFLAGRRSWQTWWRTYHGRIRPAPEESIALRFLVQAFVTLGIVALDLSANTWTSVWAVPLSILGSVWAWRQRRRLNLVTQLAIAAGMLVALAFFFSRVQANFGDTRLILAELLIHLQVLHSFDLPRRKDLGYSMVIGLILLGVAATLSQTMVFAPVLLACLAVSLPMLTLDYRSRLGLLPPIRPKRRFEELTQTIALPQLGKVLAAVLALGLVVFALLPRLPGYQIRQLPVSAPLGLSDRNFDRSELAGLIDNPGYDRDGRARGGGQSGAGSGEVDDTFYYGFSSRMNQTLSGQLRPQVVLRVRSQTEGFWRVLGFDHYTGQGWEISRNDQPYNLNRPSYSYRFLLPPEINRSKTEDIVQSFTVISTLPNLIPALAQPSELFFPTREVAIDAEGGLRSPRVLDQGLTYSVISRVPYRDRTALRQADRNYTRTIRQHYLDIEPALANRLRPKAQELLAKADSPRQDPYEIALYLAQRLKQTYRIKPDMPPIQPGEDLTEAFLFKNDGGYTDHFPTVLAMLLRSIGIPSRLAVGFAPGEFNPFTGLYEVKNTDAHAITEVYFPGYGWFAFDPIPGHPLIPPSIEENQTFSAIQKVWSWLAGWLPAPLRSWLDGLIAVIVLSLTGAIAAFLGLFTRGWGGLLVGSGLVLLFLGLVYGGWWLWQRWQQRQRWAGLAPMEVLYRQVLARLADDRPKRPWETPLDYARAYADWAIDQADRDRPAPTRPEPRSRPGDRLAVLERLSLGDRRSTVIDRADFLRQFAQAYTAWRYGQEPAEVEIWRDRWQTCERSRSNLGRPRG